MATRAQIHNPRDVLLPSMVPSLLLVRRWATPRPIQWPGFNCSVQKPRMPTCAARATAHSAEALPPRFSAITSTQDRSVTADQPAVLRIGEVDRAQPRVEPH